MITIFIDQLRKLCSERGTTPTSVCKALGLSTALPTNWKNGRFPSGTTLLKIANYFGVSVNYLLGEEEPPALTSGVNMFWQRFFVQCRKEHTTPEAVASDLAIDPRLLPIWKSGQLPGTPTLYSIAAYFNVSVDYLLGNENPPEPFATPKEAELLRRMQDLDDEQAAKLIEYMEFLLQQRKKKDGE